MEILLKQLKIGASKRARVKSLGSMVDCADESEEDSEEAGSAEEENQGRKGRI